MLIFFNSNNFGSAFEVVGVGYCEGKSYKLGFARISYWSKPILLLILKVYIIESWLFKWDIPNAWLISCNSTENRCVWSSSVFHIILNIAIHLNQYEFQ